MKQSLRTFIGKRIRLLRLQKGLTQEQVEEMADLGTNYVYKLEHLETNIKINTLEKVMEALDSDIATFFDITAKDDDPLIADLVNNLKSIPKGQQVEILSAFNTIINQVKIK
ncbi:helix-turn-helix domain-containing protein [Streptococcus suis]|uniref:helix-turn-helix domain-containing protein n=1 Tax=Streptococcus suis TaxID=1307 RepID=UPI001ABEE7C1|nr:helix-turn-helix transcriptional regulator [Streptococcus suis]